MSALKICFVSSEVAPLAKTGGLADVSSALPRFLHRAGHDVRVFLPFYSSIEIDDRELHRVEFIQDVPVKFGARSYRFSCLTTRLPSSDLWIYLVDCPELFRRDGLYTSDPDEHLRFAMLSRASIESCQRMGWGPDLFHCNDWHTGLLPLYLKTRYGWDTLFGRSRSVLTIHNIGYQGVFSGDIVEQLGLKENSQFLHHGDLRSGKLNFLKTGILYADLLTTVSPTYAREIQTTRYGMGLDDLLRARQRTLVGILNGVDYDEWSPERDSLIPVRYSIRSLPGKGKNKRALLENVGLPYAARAPVLGVVSRLTHQKGFELVFEALPEFLTQRDIRLVALGSGEPQYEAAFARLQRAFPGKVSYYRGYNNELAHLIEAGADLFLMPSRYEPCGLNQMFSLKYGTVPVVRKTGGLADSVQLYDPATGQGTGFVFEHFTADGLRWALGLALETYKDRKAWRRLMRNGMSQDFSWTAQGERYLELYRRLTGS